MRSIDVRTRIVVVWTRPQRDAITPRDLWTSSELDMAARWHHTTCSIDVWTRTTDVVASSERFASRHGLFRASRRLWLSSPTDIRTSSELGRTALWLHTTSTIDVRITTIDVLASSELLTPRHQLFEASRQLRLPPPRNIETRPLNM
jgi:hypothetical protein